MKIKITLDLVQHCSFKNFIAKNHKITTNTIDKISLSAFENKRFWLNAYESKPYRYYKTI